MSQSTKFIYCPALRMKAGELEGVRLLSSDVADCIIPRFIIPPKEDRGDAGSFLIDDLEEFPDITSALSDSWRDRPTFIDPTHIIEEYGREKMNSWLPLMFRRARESRVKAIPMAFLSDINDAEALAFRNSISVHGCIKFSICIPSGDMVGSEFNFTLQAALDRIGLTPSDCAVIVDFGGDEFGNPEIVAPIISNALEVLQEFGRWQFIIFQGTHYPEKNPAKDGTVEVWPRNEWKAWQLAVNFDPTTAEHMIFGDYAADCAKMNFDISGAPAIRHLRYATSNDWLIPRAAKTGSDMYRMHGVYKAIAESAQFAGSAFSKADEYIARVARDASAGPGSAKTWRQVNTTHHLTQVVSDIARIRGISIRRAPTGTIMEQLPLFA